MKRYTGNRPLYEAWSRSRGKSKRAGLLERLRPQVEKLRKAVAPKAKADPKPTAPVAQAPPPVTLKTPKSAKSVAEPAISGSEPKPAWLKSKAVQVNAGRIEISVPYQIAIAAGLLLVLMLLIAFKLGQVDQRAQYVTARPAARPQVPVEAETPATAGASDASSGSGAPVPTPRPAASVQGDHWIVLAYHQRYADLEAAKMYFADNDIGTEIFRVEDIRKAFIENGLDPGVLPSGEGYLLVTDRSKYYENPERPGTDGYAIKEKIKELGAAYKAPPGLDSFAPHYFGDAYGMKVSQ